MKSYQNLRISISSYHINHNPRYVFLFQLCAFGEKLKNRRERNYGPLLCYSRIMSRSEGLDHAEGAPTRFMVASGGGLSEGFGHGGSGICLGNGHAEAEGVPSQGGRGDALLRRMPPYLT